MKMSRRSVLAASTAVVLVVGFLVVRLDPGQRALADGLVQISAIFDQRKPLTTTLEVLRADGLPKELLDLKVRVQIAAPGRLHLAAEVKGERVEIGRDGQQLWTWQPARNFALLGAPDVPKYAGNPASLDATRLGPLALPVPRATLLLLPHLCSVEKLPAEKNCRVLRAQPLPVAQRMFSLPPMTLTLWLRESDTFPVKVEFDDGKKTHAAVALHSPQPGQAIEEAAWHLPKEAEPHVRRVALAHLSQFLEAAPALLNKPGGKVLGAATGSRRLIATHGAGRLENFDDTQVLFLRGTPEEMGEQHGALLAPQIRDVVRRILYGVGVGSSFAKGEWFFGTIERCQARIGRFIDPRHLREMDAIARAAGLDAEEVRLANFFPELFHCSGFALHGAATRDGHLYHGRILDYMVGAGLEPNAVVIVSQPDAGHAWVNISYAGFTGSVTAMNEAKISIGEMGGRGEGHWDGKPMAQLVREVMEKAGTLDEAVQIMRSSPRTCEYYYVIADGKTKQSVAIKATPDVFEVVHPGEAHPQLATPVKDTVLLSAGDRYVELVKRVQAGYGQFDAGRARALMTRPVCMNSNIHSVLFQTDTLDFWVANADSTRPAAHARYTHYNLAGLLNNRPPMP